MAQRILSINSLVWDRYNFPLLLNYKIIQSHDNTVLISPHIKHNQQIESDLSINVYFNNE